MGILDKQVYFINNKMPTLLHLNNDTILKESIYYQHMTTLPKVKINEKERSVLLIS